MSIDKQARDVSRYDLVSGYMQRWTDGEFVYHSDYLELLDELEAAEKRIAYQQATLNAARSYVKAHEAGDGHAFGVLQAIDRTAGISVKGE